MQKLYRWKLLHLDSRTKGAKPNAIKYPQPAGAEFIQTMRRINPVPKCAEFVRNAVNKS